MLMESSLCAGPCDKQPTELCRCQHCYGGLDPERLRSLPHARSNWWGQRSNPLASKPLLGLE